MRKVICFSALLAAAVAVSGCDVHEYPICVSCYDAGASDGRPDSALMFDAPPRHDACTDGEEVCDGYDDDCDGVADESATGTGEACGTDTGECTLGVTECVNGELVCGGDAVLPQPEVCDDKDNDCDGNVDNGNPGGNDQCGSSQGECTLGITQCVAGKVECVGGIEGIPELCDGKDNDCDGSTDEEIPQGGQCGVTDTGECVLGRFECVGGSTQCVGAVNPTLELCDTLDHDCDGNPLNTFDLNGDSRNCGACGNVCSTTNAISQCAGGACAIALCSTTWWDVNGDYSDGCEYGPCNFQSAQELCNQVDDDCDGKIDENLAPPDICEQQGACAGTVAECTDTGWVCTYGGNVETDPDGSIAPETLCDDIDNDCDGATDESHGLKGVSCYDTGTGICQGSGALVCNTADPLGPVVCDISSPGQTPGNEICNNQDDDCDAKIDEGALAGDIQDWVSVGGGVEMFAYEATRPDASTTAVGLLNNYVCSRPGALPWTNVTRPRAEAICGSIGARLCTEFEWQRACKGLPASPPPVQDAASPHLVLVEAEDYSNQFIPAGVQHAWEIDTNQGYSGVSGLRVLPNNGALINSTYAADSPRLDYDIEFNTTGTHYVWIRGWRANAADESVHAGLDGTAPTSAMDMEGFLDSWTWSNLSKQTNAAATIDVPTTGVHTLNIWMREDGFRIDSILLTTDPNYTPNQSNPSGCEWSYGTDCNTYAPTTCNGFDYDRDPATPGDQDGMLPGGQLGTCYTYWGATNAKLFDMSGNVKEWTAPRPSGINPQRGGSYTSGPNGLSCDYDFTVADDTFFFPNVGFRCCRDVP